MNLFIVRHGIAIDREDPECPPEAQRFLTPEGFKKTRKVARGFLRAGFRPKLLISSPYIRARQTAETFAEVLDLPIGNILFTESLLPEKPPNLFFEFLADQGTEDVACFGHAPNVDYLGAFVLGMPYTPFAMKKAGVAWFEISQPNPPQGILKSLFEPKLLKRLGAD